MLQQIKSGRMKQANHAARMEKMRNACEIFVEKPDGKRPHSRSGCVDRRIILKWILSK
jgi:hypothetical protein